MKNRPPWAVFLRLGHDLPELETPGKCKLYPGKCKKRLASLASLARIRPRIAPESPPNQAKRPPKTTKNGPKTPKNEPKNAEIEPKKIAPLAPLSTLGKVRASDPASGRRGTFMTPYLSLLYGEGELNMGHGQGNNVAPCRWREGWRLCFTQTIP